MKWLLLLLLLCGVAIARPGGGQTFSSGGSTRSYSSSSSSGGGGGGGYSAPRPSSSGRGTSYSSSGGSSTAGNTALGIIMLLGLSLGVFVLIAKATTQQEQRSTYTSGAPSPVPIHRVSLAPVTKVDPDFSRIIFEDFAYELYAAAQRARHDVKELAKLAPYLSEQARTELHKRHTEVEQVVIGSMHLIRAFEGAYEDYQASRIIVRFEANLANRKGSTFAVERWTFERGIDRKTTPPPEGARTWPCPNCGAPWTAGADTQTCAHCGTAIRAGRLEWAVKDIEVDTETSVGVTLTGTTPEIGNDFPTVETGDPHAALQKLRADDAALTWPSFEERVKLVYTRLNDAWNAQDLTPVRGLVTRSLLQYLQYWIDEYKRQDLHNRLDEARIKRIVLAAVARDPYYDAITVRVYAGGRDYTLDEKKNVVGGHRDKNRNYTEYWTFIRSAKRRGATVTAPSCPNCAAPLSISNAGACTHCNAHVESGEFDWVLSRIEQDDVYRG